MLLLLLVFGVSHVGRIRAGDGVMGYEPDLGPSSTAGKT